jgi:hypothetical protein
MSNFKCSSASKCAKYEYSEYTTVTASGIEIGRNDDCYGNPDFT